VSYWQRYQSDFIKLILGIFSFVVAHAVTLYIAYMLYGLTDDATRLVFVWIRELVPWGIIALGLVAAILGLVTAAFSNDRRRVPYLWIWIALIALGVTLSLLHFALGLRTGLPQLHG
jgi:hypothetical protein